MCVWERERFRVCVCEVCNVRYLCFFLFPNLKLCSLTSMSAVQCVCACVYVCERVHE